MDSLSAPQRADLSKLRGLPPSNYAEPLALDRWTGASTYHLSNHSGLPTSNYAEPLALDRLTVASTYHLSNHSGLPPSNYAEPLALDRWLEANAYHLSKNNGSAGIITKPWIDDMALRALNYPMVSPTKCKP